MAKMTRKMLRREARYQATMVTLRSLLMLGVITKHYYKIGEQLMTEKYQPASGTLFSDMALT